MARTRASARRDRGKYAFLIPILALAILASVYVVVTGPFGGASPALDYTFQINFANSTGTSLRYIIPTAPVGVPGGLWRVHTYDSLGLNGHYPIYMDIPPNPYPGYSVIHVKSLANRQFMLGDFFAVWGVTLGQSSTLNINAKGNYTWEMCIVNGQSQTPTFLWGQQPLSDGLHLSLFYYQQGTLGCA